MTKAEAREMREEIRAALDGKSTASHVGTWMGRPGVSLEVQLNSNRFGPRIHVQRFDDEQTCVVQYNKGDFWHDPDNAEVFGKTEDVAFDVASITAAAKDLIAARTAA